MDTFDRKTAVVTGAASGIGLGMVEALAYRGMRVVMADIERGGTASQGRRRANLTRYHGRVARGGHHRTSASPRRLYSGTIRHHSPGVRDCRPAALLEAKDAQASLHTCLGIAISACRLRDEWNLFHVFFDCGGCVPSEREMRAFSAPDLLEPLH